GEVATFSYPAVNVVDGRLQLRLRDAGGVDVNAVLAGLEIVTQPGATGGVAAFDSSPLDATAPASSATPSLFEHPLLRTFATPMQERTLYSPSARPKMTALANSARDEALATVSGVRSRLSNRLRSILEGVRSRRASFNSQFDEQADDTSLATLDAVWGSILLDDRESA
ncbi:MAG: hypothetical protein AAF961_09310, partial [Planctomycetota bacterium]